MIGRFMSVRQLKNMIKDDVKIYGEIHDGSDVEIKKSTKYDKTLIDNFAITEDGGLLLYLRDEHKEDKEWIIEEH